MSWPTSSAAASLPASSNAGVTRTPKGQGGGFTGHRHHDDRLKITLGPDTRDVEYVRRYRGCPQVQLFESCSICCDFQRWGVGGKVALAKGNVAQILETRSGRSASLLHVHGFNRLTRATGSYRTDSHGECRTWEPPHDVGHT